MGVLHQCGLWRPEGLVATREDMGVYINVIYGGLSPQCKGGLAPRQVSKLLIPTSICIASMLRVKITGHLSSLFLPLLPFLAPLRS
jgi:hypothetical protein